MNLLLPLLLETCSGEYSELLVGSLPEFGVDLVLRNELDVSDLLQM
jgi:hypothetical protein